MKGFDGTRPRTLALYKGLAERYVNPVLGGVRLDKLTPAHIQHAIAKPREARLPVLPPCCMFTSSSATPWATLTGWS
jgi:Phage integrase, N-terminal SAM-like domain